MNWPCISSEYVDMEIYQPNADSLRNTKCSDNMNELPIESEGRAEIRGFHFKQPIKSATAYMYHKSYNGMAYHEVFRLKVGQKFHSVIYPGSKSFGLWAWDYKDYKKVLKRFIELVK